MQRQVDDVQSDEDINWMRNKFIIQWWRKMTGVSKTDGVKHEESHQPQAIMLVATKHDPLTHSPATISD